MKTLSALHLACALSFIDGGLQASADPQRSSPHELVELQPGTAHVTLSYGRPSVKDPKSGRPRKVWGSLVPYGRIWCTGADEATVFSTDKPLWFDPPSPLGTERFRGAELEKSGTKIPAGAYSLWMMPLEDGTARLVLNGQVGQWGTKHDASKDLATVILIAHPLDLPMNKFTISIEKAPNFGGMFILALAWERTKYSALFEVDE